MDHSRESGIDGASGILLCAGGDAEGSHHCGQGSGRHVPQTLPAGRQGCRHRPGRGTGTDQIPSSVLRPRVARASRDVRDAGAGHGHRPFVSRLRHRGLPVVSQLRHEGRGHHQSGAGRRPLCRQPAVLRRRKNLGGQSANRGQAARCGALFHDTKYTHSYMHCWRHKTPIIYRATTQWFAGMDGVPGWHGHAPPETLRAVALRGIDATRVLPGLGQGPPVRNDRQSSRLDAVAAAPVGCAAAIFRRQGNRPAASGYDGAAGTWPRSRWRRAGSNPGSPRRTRTLASIRPNTARSPTRSTSGSTRAARFRPSWEVRTVAHRGWARTPQPTTFRPTCTSRVRTSIAAGSIRHCSSRAWSMACRRTRRCSHMASRSMAKAGRCRNRRATSSRRSRSRNRRARKFFGCGLPRRIIPANSRSPTKS